MNNKIHHLQDVNNEMLAYYFNDLKSDTTIFFFGGYSSDMTGTKATALNNWTESNGINYLRFDYSGHGQSSGDLGKGTLSSWLGEAEFFFEKFKSKKNIIIGSSMGGWIALLTALKNIDVNGLIGIASAPDFTKNEWDKLSETEKEEFKSNGSILFPDDDYGDYEVFYEFVKDGFQHEILNDKIEITCPVRLLHGKLDKVIAYNVSEKIIEQLSTSDKSLTIIEDGDHNLSRQEDLEILFTKVKELI
ncbi:MAG: alpha/beta hydrolase [Candidatus Pelagibacterales bacterium]